MAAINILEFSYPEDCLHAIQLWESIDKGIHLGPSDAQTEIAKKLQRDPDLFLVAEADGDLIGTVIGGYDGRRGFIYHLAVSQEHRGKGIGSRLMDEVEARLRNKGCIRCYLFVTADNEEAMRYYEKRGWQFMVNLPYAKDLSP